MSIEGVPQNSNPAADSDDATQKTNIDVATEKFYKTVEKLPTDMASSWILKFEDLDSENELEKFFNEFDTFLQNRELALAGNSLEIHPEADARIREEVLKVHEYIKKTFGDPNYFLGNGATAEVYTLPIAPDLCTKYIHSQDAYNENNHMRKEYGFLDELHTFSHAGVRTPKPYFLRIHPSEGHSYGMERIEGENLSRILEEPSKNIELITLLKTLDRQRVEESLVSYVETMHKQLHHILFEELK